MIRERYSVELRTPVATYLAQEASPTDIAAAADQLALWYSDAYNRQMMDGRQMMRQDVLDSYHEAWAHGTRPFLLYHDGRLVGDADFRHLRPPIAEFAIMIGPSCSQGKGLGTHFSRLLHHLAFTRLGLATVYLTVVPRNLPARRCYEKIGYCLDTSLAAGQFKEASDDLPMSLTRQAFHTFNPGIASDVTVSLLPSLFAKGFDRAGLP